MGHRLFLNGMSGEDLKRRIGEVRRREGSAWLSDAPAID
jgi:hypothetical protein